MGHKVCGCWCTYVFGARCGASCLYLLALARELGKLAFESCNLVDQLPASRLERLLVKLRVERCPHAKRNRALVRNLVCRNGHAQLVAHTQEKKSPLCLIERALPDELVKGLRVEVTPDRTEACFTCLFLLELVIQPGWSGVYV
jgi:hypothetical protein